MFKIQPSTFQPTKKQFQLYIIIASVVLNFLFLSLLVSIYTKYESDTNQLASKINSLYIENEALDKNNTAMAKQLSYYTVNKAYLISTGASANQADIILKASTLYGKGNADFPK